MAKNKIIENAIVAKDSDIVYYSNNFEIPSMDTALVHVERDGKVAEKYVYFTFDKDGNKERHETTNELVISSLTSIDFWAKLGRKAPQAISIEMSLITDEMAKSEGFKNGAKEMIKKVYPDYSDNTINQYRRAGWLFGVKETDENGKVSYRWREPIPQHVALTNLTQCLTLCEIPDNYTKLSENEIIAIFDKFYTQYVESGEIHLWEKQSVLKEEIAKTKNTIDGNGTEKKSDEKKSDGKSDEKKSDEKKSDVKSDEIKKESKKESAMLAITSLQILLGESAKALLAELTKMAEALED